MMEPKDTLSGPPCYEDGDFIDYIFSSLPEDKQGEIEEHLKKCKRCRLEVVRFRKAIIEAETPLSKEKESELKTVQERVREKLLNFINKGKAASVEKTKPGTDEPKKTIPLIKVFLEKDPPNFAAAIECFQAAAQLSSEHAEVLFINKTEDLLQENRISSAIEFLQALQQLVPQDLDLEDLILDKEFALFQTDSDGIISLKMDFIRDGGEFLYLRKGEDVGAIEVAAYTYRLIEMAASSGATFADWSQKAAQLAQRATSIIKTGSIKTREQWENALNALDSFRHRWQASRKNTRMFNRIFEPPDKDALKESTLLPSPFPTDFRIICNRDKVNEKALPVFTKLGVRVRHRPKGTDYGKHRYYLNDHRVAWFLRTPGDRFVGIVSSNTSLREHLKKDFWSEWEKYGPDVKK